MGTQGNIKNSYVLKGKIRDVPGVDKTLTLEGYCADAKATGEALTAAGRSLESQGNDIDILKSGLEFERKRIEMMIASGNTNGLTTYNFTFLDGYNKTVNATAISNGSVVVVRTETFGVKGVGAANQNPLPYTLIEFPSMPDEFRCAFENGYIDVKHAGSEQSDVYYIEDGTDIKIKNTTAEGFSVEYLELCYPLETVRIPEVMDARIGADGTEYRNLGTAIRAQLNLKTDKCFTDEKQVYMAEPARMHVGEEFEAGDTIRYYWEASELEIGVDYNDGTASEVIKTPETPGSSELVIGENYASVRFDEGFTVCLPNKKALPDNTELTDGSYFIVGENGSSTKIAYPLLKESIVGELPGTVKELTQHVTEGFETVNEEVSNVKGEVERIRKDLITPVVKVTKTEEGCVVSATDKNGTTEVTIRNGQDGKEGENGLDGQDGKDGENGTDGEDGVGIASVTQTKVSSEDGGTNELTFELTNGEKKVFVVNNGKRGSDGQDGEDGKDAYEYAKEGGYTGTEAEFAELMARGRDVPTKVSELENDAGFLTQHQDLSGYAKSSEIPTKTSQLTNDSGYLDGEHNTSETAHSDIRLSIQGLMNQLYAIADSDDATLDQLSEIVGYIKSNKSLIESITTNKVEVSHIVDNLYSNVANRPLSAAQGVVLKGLIDNLSTEVTNHISTAGDKVDAHNTNENAHEDIRYMIDQHTNQFGNYVQKQHIVDNLEQSASGNTVLSAHQGYVLKQLIEAIIVPKKLSELENDKEFVTKEEVESIVSESGGSSTETGIETIKLYVNPTDGATTGSNTVTSDKDNFGSIFDMTEPELHSCVLVYKNESNDIGYTPDTVRTYIASGTLLGMYDGRTVVIRAGKYELTIVEKVADDGVISYVSLWNIRKDITTDVISTNKKTDAMTLPVGLNKETGVLWAEPNVVPVAKTDAMTQEVGVDSEGKLFTAPGGSVSDEQIESAVNSYLEENPVSSGTGKWSELSGLPVINTTVTSETEEELLAETTVTFGEHSRCLYNLDPAIFPNGKDTEYLDSIVGSNIRMQIDGVEYSSKLTKGEGTLDGMPVSLYAAGNPTLYYSLHQDGESTGEVFRLYALFVNGEIQNVEVNLSPEAFAGTDHAIKIEAITVEEKTASNPLPENYPLNELPVSWNSIADKPFAETITGYTWDGDMNGKTLVADGFVKISECENTSIAELYGGIVEVTAVGSPVVFPDTLISEDTCSTLDDSGYAYAITNPDVNQIVAFVCLSETNIMSGEETITLASGIYAFYIVDGPMVAYTSLIGMRDITPIPERFLPLPPCTLTITDATTVTAEILNTTIPAEYAGSYLYQMDNEDLLKAKIIIKDSTQNIINYATPSYTGYLGDTNNSKLIAFVAGIGIAYIAIASDGTMTYITDFN